MFINDAWLVEAWMLEAPLGRCSLPSLDFHCLYALDKDFHPFRKDSPFHRRNCVHTHSICSAGFHNSRDRIARLDYIAGVLGDSLGLLNKI